jgi:hypothetical protein
MFRSPALRAITCMPWAVLATAVSAYGEGECDAKQWVRLDSERRFGDSETRVLVQAVPLSAQTKRMAIERLSKISISKIDAHEASMVGIDELIPGKQAFFVRGVARNIRTGTWRVSVIRNAIFVIHTSVGSESHSTFQIPDLRCEPILVFLDRTPSEVFVGAFWIY